MTHCPEIIHIWLIGGNNPFCCLFYGPKLWDYERRWRGLQWHRRCCPPHGPLSTPDTLCPLRLIFTTSLKTSYYVSTLGQRKWCSERLINTLKIPQLEVKFSKLLLNDSKCGKACKTSSMERKARVRRKDRTFVRRPMWLTELLLCPT